MKLAAGVKPDYFEKIDNLELTIQLYFLAWLNP